MRDLNVALSRIIDQVHAAHSSGRPLEIRGDGSKHFYGEPALGEILEISPFTGITSYEPTELVVTARAGTTLTELEATLQQCGQSLPFEPPRFAGRGTVGGMVAAGLAGPARARVGSVRDHVLGMTVLNAGGDLLTFGGQVAKNVAGYDVSRLMVGALGILGVICDVSLKVLPTPVATATCAYDCSETEALRRLNAWRSNPLPIDAISWHDDVLCVRFAGAKAAVIEARRNLGGREIAAQSAQSWWTALRDHRHEYFNLSQEELQRGECLWRLSVRASAASLSMPGRQLIEWQGAQRWCRTQAPAHEVRAAATLAGGHATLMRAASKSAGVFTPLSEALMRVHRRLKQAFDPNRIFNRGRMYAEL